MHANGRYDHYKKSVFQSQIEKCQQLYPVVVRFGELWTVGRSGGLQGVTEEKRKLRFAR